MKKQLCRLQEQQQLQKFRPTIIIGDSIPYTVSKQIQMPSSTPHILTPNSTDELLPSVEENDEFSPQFDRKNQPWWQTCNWLTQPLNWNLLQFASEISENFLQKTTKKKSFLSKTKKNKKKNKEKSKKACWMFNSFLSRKLWKLTAEKINASMRQTTGSSQHPIIRLWTLKTNNFLQKKKSLISSF